MSVKKSMWRVYSNLGLWLELILAEDRETRARETLLISGLTPAIWYGSWQTSC
jgi:hypothetical protein